MGGGGGVGVGGGGCGGGGARTAGNPQLLGIRPSLGRKGQDQTLLAEPASAVEESPT